MKGSLIDEGPNKIRRGGGKKLTINKQGGRLFGT